ncbi:MAG: glycosyltransferase [Desulfobacteraceae bacterium]|nr:glycosyltransferase [Desulfobacteraceae bacterium]
MKDQNMSENSKSFLSAIMTAIIICILFFILSYAHLSLMHQALLGGVLFIVIVITAKTSQYFGQAGRILLMMLCLFLTLRYWLFRVTVTLTLNGVFDYIFALILFAAETYGILIYLFGMFVNVWPVDRKSPVLPEDKGLLPSVDIYIPTYNEPEEMVEITALASTQILYPKELINIYILDDGGTLQKLTDPDIKKAEQAQKRAEHLKKVASDLGIFYATRDENVFAKAGNINEVLMSCECRLDEDAFDRVSCINAGIEQGCGDLILVLDCDHVPARDFLEKTVGFFIDDSKLFLLQTPHHFINPDPLEKNLNTFRKNPSENEMFYGAIHPGLDFWNASFFCGSAAVLRRKHLMEVDGIAGNSITEDVETALDLHARGYNSAYLKKPLIIGLTPETFADFIIQRSRWAQGMIQIFILKNPLLQKGLSISQKICYLNSTMFWFFGIARIIFYLSPLMLLFFGLRIYNASISQVLAYAVPHLLGAYILSNFLFGKFRHPFFSELYETLQSIYLLPAIFSVIAKPRAPVFKVTPKSVSLGEDFLSHLALPFYLMLIICFAAYGFGLVKIINSPEMLDSILICLGWNTFNIVLLLSCLGVVWEKKQFRGKHRYPTDESIQIEFAGSFIHARITDLSISGAGITICEPLPDNHPNSLVIHATDSQGTTYQLPMNILNESNTKNKIRLGCSFVRQNLHQFTQIVNFVYGNSSRWKFYGEHGRRRGIGTLIGFVKILRIGGYGLVSNFKGIWTILHLRLRGYYLRINPWINKRNEDNL